MKTGFLAGAAVLLICTFSGHCFAEEKRDTISSGKWEYYQNEDGTATISGWRGEEENLVIPSTLDGCRVTEIGEQAFYACTDVKDITIPASVTEIGKEAFYGCGKLDAEQVYARP